MSSASQVQVREASTADLTRIVAVHLDSFPSFFLSFLGPRFLQEFYRGLLDAPLGILQVAEADGCVVGFVGGTTDEALFFRWLMEHRRVTFIREAALATLRHPSASSRLWRARHRSAEAQQSSAPTVLLTIGVDPGLQGRGLGAALFGSFAKRAAASGARSFCLATDALGNDTVNAFYVRQGCRLSRSFTTAEGRRMYEYVWAERIGYLGDGLPD